MPKADGLSEKGTDGCKASRATVRLLTFITLRLISTLRVLYCGKEKHSVRITAHLQPSKSTSWLVYLILLHCDYIWKVKT